MELKTYFAQDTDGKVLPEASVFLYQPDTTELVGDVRDAAGNALPNPFAADGDGLIQLAAADGKYDLRVSKGGLDYTMRVQFLDAAQAVDTIVASADRAETARDASIVNAQLYPDIETGRAAVADGETFDVQGAGDVAVIRYRRLTATTHAGPIATFPSSAAVEEVKELISDDGVEGRNAVVFEDAGGRVAASIRGDGVFEAARIAAEVFEDRVGQVAARIRGDGTFEAARIAVEHSSDDDLLVIEDEVGNQALRILKTGEMRSPNDLSVTYGDGSTKRRVRNIEFDAASISVAETKNGIRVLAKGEGFVTPELYGAKGDGVALDASAINTMLQENSVCRGTPGAVYLIDDPIVIPSNTYFDFSRSTLRLANGANCYMLVNEDPTNGDENIILVRGKLDGNSAGQTRNYTSSYLTGYFGFGAAFTKVDNLIIQDWDVADTEAWGISYWHCGSVMFDNFRFDQAETSGQNGDGITGSARCVLVSNISGYTNDDIVAVGTGKATLGGNDTGTDPADELEVERVVLRNIYGRKKGATNAHVGVGVYGSRGGRFKSVIIENLQGVFDYYAYRVQNYWPTEGEFYIDSLVIDGVHVEDIDSSNIIGKIQDVTTIHRAVVSDHRIDMEGASHRPLLVDGSNIHDLELRGNRYTTNTAIGGRAFLEVRQNPSTGVHRLSAHGTSINRSDAGSENSIIMLDCASGALPLVLSAENNGVATSRGLGHLIGWQDMVDIINPSYADVLYNGGQPVASLLSLANGWAANSAGYDDRIAVIAAGGAVRLNGVMEVGTLTPGTTLTTVPAGLRPRMKKSGRLPGVNGSGAYLVVSVDTAGSVDVVASSGLTAGDLVDLSSLHYSLA